MLIAISFLVLGLLIGTLTALTAESVVSTLLPLIFTFAGGSAIAFGSTLKKEVLNLASVAILTLSIGALSGIYSGVYIFEHKLLTPENKRESRSETPYLRNLKIEKINIIDHQKRSGVLTTEEAYQEILNIMKNQE